MTQITGHTIRPNQKIRDSESEGWFFPEGCGGKKQHILKVGTNTDEVKIVCLHRDACYFSDLPGLKNPVTSSVVVHLVPPAQTHHQSA